MTVLLLDNYDSFTYNIYHALLQTSKVVIARNDKITIAQIRQMSLKAIVISPGPLTPDKAGISVQVVTEFAANLAILGICLGHQIIAQVFRSKVSRSKTPYHGKVSKIQHHNNSILFHNIENSFTATRYHSLVIDKSTLSEQLRATAHSCDDKEIMAIEHIKYPIYGIQFHPESILTPCGQAILDNFVCSID